MKKVGGGLSYDFLSLFWQENLNERSGITGFEGPRDGL
jgi:hypothetical protein